MVIKGWIKEGSWLDRSLYIVPEKNKNKETYEINYSLKLDCQLSKFNGKFVKARYAIKNKKFDDITEELFDQLYGELNEEDVEFNISEITINSYCNNVIGGHNITEALRNHIDKYVIIEVEEVEKPSWLKKEEN